MESAERIGAEMVVVISPLTQAKPTESAGTGKECVKRTETKRKANEYPEETESLVDRMVERGNMNTAYCRVVKNGGAAGTDGVTTSELRVYVKKNWAVIRKELLEGKYKPKPVRRVEIEKPNGGVRQLGIPTVMDRLIQQAMYQVLEPIFEPTFSENSFGFRKNRGAHDAIKACKSYVKEGRKYVVDMDIRKFFDEVDHRILLEKIRKRVKDKMMIKLIKSYLKAGVLVGNVVEPSYKGTPQGGPLSPLLSNIMLDELDKELEKRGHTFARYADDCNIYVKSKRAGNRVFKSVIRVLKEKLKLTVNTEKSSVDLVSRRKFLGYTIILGKEPRINVAKESVIRLINKLRKVFSERKYLPMDRLIEELNKILAGWIEYFRLAETKTFAEKADEWVRRKLRRKIWKDWKNPWTRAKNLINAGIAKKWAYHSGFNGRGNWWNAGSKHMKQACPNKYFKDLKLVFMAERLTGA